MATHNQDIKTLFELYDCQPNQRRFEKFLNSLLATGGRCDIDGWSLADCLQRFDDGAVTALGAAAPNAGGLIAANGGGAPMEKRRGLRRARLKMSFSHLILHLDHPEVKAILSKAPFLGNGPAALDYLRQRCSTPGNTGEQQDKQMEWCSLTIKGNIGIDENTLINLDLRLSGSRRSTRRCCLSTPTPATCRARRSCARSPAPPRSSWSRRRASSTQ